MKVYFAGPFYPLRARLHRRLCGTDPGGWNRSFCPHEIPLPDPVTPKFIFDTDSRAVLEAHVVLALLDGPSVDDGTANEIGIFWSAMRSDPTKKGIIGLVTDTRVIRDRNMIDGKGINLFVRGCIEDSGVMVDNFQAALEQLLVWKSEA